MKRLVATWALIAITLSWSTLAWAQSPPPVFFVVQGNIANGDQFDAGFPYKFDTGTGGGSKSRLIPAGLNWGSLGVSASINPASLSVTFDGTMDAVHASRICNIYYGCGFYLNANTQYSGIDVYILGDPGTEFKLVQTSSGNLIGSVAETHACDRNYANAQASATWVGNPVITATTEQGTGGYCGIPAPKFGSADVAESRQINGKSTGRTWLYNGNIYSFAYSLGTNLTLNMYAEGDPDFTAHSKGNVTVSIAVQVIRPNLPTLRIDSVDLKHEASLEPFIPADNPGRNVDANKVPLRVGCYDAQNVNVPCSWELFLSRGSLNEAQTGHGGTHKPQGPSPGHLSQSSCSNCLATDVTYTAGEVAGSIVLTPLCDANCTTGSSKTLTAAIRDLQNVRTQTNTKISLAPDRVHGNGNGWVTVDAIAALRRIADCWTGRSPCYAAGSGNPVALPGPVEAGVNDWLYLNDLGLHFGGKFDLADAHAPIPTGLWEASGSHDWHRIGRSVNIRIKNADGAFLTATQLEVLASLFRMHGFGFMVRGEMPGDAETHWHGEFTGAASNVTAPATTNARSSSRVSDTLCTVDLSAAAANVQSTVTYDASRNVFRYQYTVTNTSASMVSLADFVLEMQVPVSSRQVPPGWILIDTREATGDVGLGWTATDLAAPDERTGDVPVSRSALAPGQAAVFVIESVNPPGSLTYHANFVMPVTPTVSEDALGAFAASCPMTAKTVTGQTEGPGIGQVQYLAEGATGSFFETRFALLNPWPTPTTATLRFLKDDGNTVTQTLALPEHARRTLVASSIAGLESANFSTVIESGPQLVVDRTMSWDKSGYGSDAETAIQAPSPIWYFAEGSTSGEFALFYLLQNANDSEVGVNIRYLLPPGFPPIVRRYTLAPHSRTTLPIDDLDPALANTDVSAEITASAPIIAERAMYRTSPTQAFAAGHESAGVTAPSLHWFLAEGATGPFFDMFILIANPSAQDATCRVDYLLSTGEVLSKNYTVAANSRLTIPVDSEEIPAGSGHHPLTNVAVSSSITSTDNVPIIVERTMWWPSPELSSNFWTEAHNSPGATQGGTQWALAEGEVGGADAAETYILIANTSTTGGTARVTLYFEDGTVAEKNFDLLPTSRTNVNVSWEFPGAANKRFGAVVESLGVIPAQIIVERAMYTSPGGVTWAAGTNALATRLQ